MNPELGAILSRADEVMAGFGRAGEWFAWQNWTVEPDLIAFAKGVNSGYVPLGGVIVSAGAPEDPWPLDPSPP